jgi:hypothetical protein
MAKSCSKVHCGLGICPSDCCYTKDPGVRLDVLNVWMNKHTVCCRPVPVAYLGLLSTKHSTPPGFTMRAASLMKDVMAAWMPQQQQQQQQQCETGMLRCDSVKQQATLLPLCKWQCQCSSAAESIAVAALSKCWQPNFLGTWRAWCGSDNPQGNSVQCHAVWQTAGVVVAVTKSKITLS